METAERGLDKEDRRRKLLEEYCLHYPNSPIAWLCMLETLAPIREELRGLYE